MKRHLLVAWILICACLPIAAQQLRTNISVHDPVMIRQDSTYYVFCTGKGIAIWSSKDMVHWRSEKPVFEKAPQWAVDTIPGFGNYIWAPDISYHNGLYYLFYAVSAFGKNTSAIGSATNTTLQASDPNYHWVDHGRIIQSYPGKSHWNAIDPNLITDVDGTPYIAFGSFWDGIKLIRLSTDRMQIAEKVDNIPTIATRKKRPVDDMPALEGNPVDAGGNAIEAPFIFRHQQYYYLFASIDYCCKGPNSTYKMIVGRAKKLKGPYVDQKGIAMNKGGGTIVLAGDKRWYGVGHNGVTTLGATDYLVFHGYDALDKGRSKLRIEKLAWTDGWPIVRGLDN